MKCPELLDLSSLMSVEVELELPPQLWKISTLGGNDLKYTVMLSYLLSFSRKNFVADSSIYLKKLFQFEEKNNIEEVNFRQIIRGIMHFNPFKNFRRPVFHHKVLISALKAFEEKLNLFIKKMDTCSEKSEYCKICEAASNMLECCIVFFGSEEIKLFNTGLSSKILFIFNDKAENFSTSGNISKIDTFAFGMSNEHSLFLRKQALINVLRVAKITNNVINMFRNEIFCTQDFLICLIQCENKDVLTQIFKFPYIAMLLAEAGFNTNPLKADNHKLSAFFYCIKEFDIATLTLLYNHAANNFNLTEDSVRNPKINIVTALEKIGHVLKNDCLILRNFTGLGETKDEVIKIYIQVLHFNDYQINTVKEIISINDSKGSLKEKMISILHNYCNHFYYNNLTDYPSKFEDYVTYQEYYNFLDNFFCLLFFDNFILLSSYVNETNKSIYIEVASSLLQLIFSCDLFPLTKHRIYGFSDHPRKEDWAFSMNLDRFIPFSYRLKVFDCCLKLKSELERSSIESCQQPTSQANSKQPEFLDIIRDSLVHFPEISNQFITKRITIYLKAVEMLWMKGDIESNMLIIERALQVVGELIENKTVNSRCIRDFLCSYLSNHTEHQLCQIRDHLLSKYRADTIQGRICFERNKDMFENIRYELHLMLHFFQPIYVIQFYQIEIAMIESGRNIACKTCKDAFDYLDTKYFYVVENQSVMYLRYQKEICRLFKYMLIHSINSFKNTYTCDSERCEKLNNELYSLNYLFDLISTCYENKEFRAMKSDFKVLKSSKLDIKDMEAFAYQKQEVLDALENCSDKSKKICKYGSELKTIDRKFCTIKNLLSEIDQCNIFDEDENKLIRREIQQHLVSSNENKTFCVQNILDTPSSHIKEKLSCVVMTNKYRKCIYDNIEKNKKKALHCLEQVKNVDENILKDEINITQKLLSMYREHEYKNFLLIMNFDDNLQMKILRLINQKVYFLINRIDKLAKILIENDEHIKFYWQYRNDKALKEHTKLLMCQRYIKEIHIRAATETLFFDCMNILDSEKLKRLWKKATYLFSGINLRDVISHSNPVLEIIGSALDPRDLPYAFINAITELIEDRESLWAMSRLWYRLKLTKLNDFINEVEVEDLELRRKIKSSQRWQEYVKLLPLEK